MTTASVNIRVPNGLVIIRDPSQTAFPEITRDANIWIGQSCILMHSLPDIDGQTTITLGGLNEVGSTNHLTDDNVMASPSRVVEIDIVPGRRVLSRRVTRAETRIRIWTDGEWMPELVTIGVE